MNVGLMPIRHQISRQRYNKMKNPTIEITTQGAITTVVNNMDMLLRISLENISEATETDG